MEKVSVSRALHMAIVNNYYSRIYHFMAIYPLIEGFVLIKEYDNAHATALLYRVVHN